MISGKYIDKTAWQGFSAAVSASMRVEYNLHGYLQRKNQIIHICFLTAYAII